MPAGARSEEIAAHPTFLSYRRSDSRGYAFALFREFQRPFGRDAPFYDKNNIESGADFTRPNRAGRRNLIVLARMADPRIHGRGLAFE